MRYFFPFFFIFFTLCLFGNNDVKKILISGKWFSRIDQNEPFGVSFKFSDKKIEIKNRTMGGDVDYSVSYKIEKDSLITFTINDPQSKKKILFKFKFNSGNDSPIFENHLSLYNDEELYYTFSSSRDYRRIWNHNSLRKENSEISYKKSDVVILGLKKGKVVEALKMREAPDTSSRYYLVSRSDGKILRSLPKGTNLTIIARSKEKFKVSEWNNYWYLVRPTFDVSDSIIFEGDEVALDPDWVDFWVYGEFVKPDSK